MPPGKCVVAWQWVDTAAPAQRSPRSYPCPNPPPNRQEAKDLSNIGYTWPDLTRNRLCLKSASPGFSKSTRLRRSSWEDLLNFLEWGPRLTPASPRLPKRLQEEAKIIVSAFLNRFLTKNCEQAVRPILYSLHTCPTNNQWFWDSPATQHAFNNHPASFACLGPPKSPVAKRMLVASTLPPNAPTHTPVWPPELAKIFIWRHLQAPRPPKIAFGIQYTPIPIEAQYILNTLHKFLIYRHQLL